MSLFLIIVLLLTGSVIHNLDPIKVMEQIDYVALTYRSRALLCGIALRPSQR